MNIRSELMAAAHTLAPSTEWSMADTVGKPTAWR